MRSDELIPHGEHVMTVCNACRYCEQFCPVFPAMENRLTFAKGDLMYLANLCHNCGECLYACQYAPPHEFGINVPQTMAGLRLQSYEDYCWPKSLGLLFRRNGILTSVALAAVLTGIMVAATLLFGGDDPWQTAGGDFYAVLPHGLMVSLFGAVSGFVTLALGIGVRRFWRDIESSGGPARSEPKALTVALRDVLTLRHLHASGENCTSSEQDRTPWRRWFHHCTFYGFLLCFASTSVAAIYHSMFQWEAPYPYVSLPVVLGTIGGIGLLIGPAGLLVLRHRRDRSLGDPDQKGMDVSFITLLFLTSLTGMLLLVLRERTVMAPLLVVHLGVVLALFVTLPYGKFVHGLYRAAALIKYTNEDLAWLPEVARPDRAPALGTPDYLGARPPVQGEQPIQ
ncbi:MAG: tricarballylate utilization 4Fe-4S protein TcuB [Vicinamibacterales bacterium]